MESIKKEAISLTERTQSVSSVPKIPKDFNEFKSRYNELLDYHLTQNKYHNELTFVKEWITIYSNGIDILKKRTDPETLTEKEQRGLEALRTPYGYYDVKFSFGLICKFLKERKKEVKTELKTKLESLQQNEIVNSTEIKERKSDSKTLSQQIGTEKVKKEFKDFFNDNVTIKIIEEIQKNFKDYENKKMAYLIYLLHKEFNLINYSVNSRDMSRKHFVE